MKDMATMLGEAKAQGYKEGRADVIDGFIEEMKKEPFSDYVMDIVYHIAERLKEQSND